MKNWTKLKYFGRLQLKKHPNMVPVCNAILHSSAFQIASALLSDRTKKHAYLRT